MCMTAMTSSSSPRMRKTSAYGKTSKRHLRNSPSKQRWISGFAIMRFSASFHCRRKRIPRPCCCKSYHVAASSPSCRAHRSYITRMAQNVVSKRWLTSFHRSSAGIKLAFPASISPIRRCNSSRHSGLNWNSSSSRLSRSRLASLERSPRGRRRTSSSNRS